MWCDDGREGEKETGRERCDFTAVVICREPFPRTELMV